MLWCFRRLFCSFGIRLLNGLLHEEALAEFVRTQCRELSAMGVLQ